MDKSHGKKAITPILTLEPIRIENFSYLNAQIKVLLSKYRNSTRNSKFIDEIFKEGEIDLKKCLLKNTMGKREKIGIENVLVGFLEEKILERNEKFIRNCKKIAQEKIESKKDQIQTIKKETEFKMRKVSPNDLKFIESNFNNSSPLLEFSNPFIFMVYRFFDPNKSIKIDHQNMRRSLFHDQLNFLENEYYEFVKRSVSHKRAPIQQFVRAKYASRDLYIESYDNRLLFVEIFIHIRCGQVSKALDLITDFSFFFDTTAPGLRNLIVSFYNGKKIPIYEYTKIINTKSDRFKIIIYQILTEHSQITDILTTFNDFLWFKMLHSTSINDLYSKNELKSTDECKMIVALFCKKYDKTFSILAKESFPLVETFFTMRRMAFAVKIIEPFAELVFSLIKQFAKQSNKVRLINMLDQEGFYSSVSDSSFTLSSRTQYSSQGQTVTDDSITELSATSSQTDHSQNNLFRADISNKEDRSEFGHREIESHSLPSGHIFETDLEGKSSKSNDLEDAEQKFSGKKIKILRKPIKTDKPVSQTIAELIIKSDNLDLLDINEKMSALKTDIVNNIANILYQKGDRKNLLKLYNFFDNQDRIREILNEYLTDLILKDKKEIFEHREVINHFKKSKTCPETQRMSVLIDLIDFSRTNDIFYLKSSLLFNNSPVTFLPHFKPLVSKLLPLITKSIQETNDRPMAQIFSKLCNMMGMGERCRTLMGEQLIMML